MWSSREEEEVATPFPIACSVSGCSGANITAAAVRGLAHWRVKPTVMRGQVDTAAMRYSGSSALSSDGSLCGLGRRVGAGGVWAAGGLARRRASSRFLALAAALRPLANRFLKLYLEW